MSSHVHSTSVSSSLNQPSAVQDRLANNLSDSSQPLLSRQEQEELLESLSWLKEENARVLALLEKRDESITWLQGELSLAHQEAIRFRRLKNSFPYRLAAKGWRVLRPIRVLANILLNPFLWLGYQQWYWQLRARLKGLLRLVLPLSLRRWLKGKLVTSPQFVPALELVGKTDDAFLAAELAELPPPTGYKKLTLLPHLDEQQLTDLPEVFAQEDIKRPDVICFSIIDWDFRYQRPQQLMSQFAAHGHRVFYLSTTRTLPNNAKQRIAIREIKENVYEVVLAAQRLPDVYGEVIEGNNEKALMESLAELRRTFRIDSAIAYIMIASWGKLALATSQHWGWQTTYDCMDEWDNFPGVKPTLLEMERTLVKECDELVVTAQRLYDKWKSYRRSVVLARNGVDYDFFAQRCQPNALLEPKPQDITVGYYGAIADWFDVALMEYLAKARPHYQFILLGGVFDVDVSALRVLPNVKLLGQQPYETMPQYLYHFKACIIPFKINPITDATDPVKLYEYLSGGKPVVATNMQELKPYHDVVYLAQTHDEFVVKLDQALAEDSPALAEQRRAFARTHTWEKRYEAICQEMTDNTPCASIIIVTWRNLVLTQLCLESVLRNTEYTNFEIIVVDNHSDDGTPAYLREMATRHKRIKILLNDTNYGFAKANNQGIAISRGEYLVLLNNDTIVPPGWLNRLLLHLRDSSVGLVGPVTNAVGNEAKLNVTYKTWFEMEAFARSFTWQHDHQIADIHMLAMFCVAMSRKTYNTLGPLDEQFGIGMFEDDDYSQRMKTAGLRVVCAADVFIHHFGQAAFKQLIANGNYNPLFEENRRRYESKWQIKWIPHKHATLLFEPHGVGTASSS